MTQRLSGYACLTLAMIGVGSTVVASRLAGAGLPPFTATALRFLIAFPLFWLVLRARRVPWPRLGRRDLALLAVQAGAGSVGYTVLLIAGTGLTSAADAGVVLGTLPAMTTLFAAVALRERQGGRDWAATALATAGAVAVTLGARDSGPASAHALAGTLLVLGAVACEAVFILLNKRLHVALPPLVQSAVMTGLGLVLSLVPAVVLERDWAALAAAPTALAAVAYYAVVPTVLGFLLWFAGTARTTGTQAALFTAFAPASAVVFAVLLLGEPLTPARIAGLALVLAGVLLGATGGRG
jgi:drug/metabolite transporter (DMT)-like permease